MTGGKTGMPARTKNPVKNLTFKKKGLTLKQDVILEKSCCYANFPKTSCCGGSVGWAVLPLHGQQFHRHDARYVAHGLSDEGQLPFLRRFCRG